MRKKVWLARTCSGDYNIFSNSPELIKKADNWFGGHITYWEGKSIVSGLCPDLVKFWFGLKRHLKRKTCIQGTFSVSFTPDKKKGG